MYMYMKYDGTSYQRQKTYTLLCHGPMYGVVFHVSR
jgi:hypothetical protein